MAHLSAGEAGKRILWVSKGQDMGLVNSQPVSATLVLETAEMLADLCVATQVLATQ